MTHRAQWTVPLLFLASTLGLAGPLTAQQASAGSQAADAVELLMQQIHAARTLVKLQPTREQWTAIRDSAVDIARKRQAIEEQHARQLMDLLPRLRETLAAFQTGDFGPAENRLDIARERLEDILEEYEAGLAALRDEVVGAYALFTEEQRAVCFDEFFAERTTRMRLDELALVPQTERETSIAEIADTLVEQAAVVDDDGFLVEPDREQILAVLREAAAASPTDYAGLRAGLVSRIVALYPAQPQGMMSADALGNFVKFLSCPSLDGIIEAMARHVP